MKFNHPLTETTDDEIERVFGPAPATPPRQYTPRRSGPLPGSLRHDEGCTCAECTVPHFPRRMD